jgi:hypothetical protein
LSTLGIDLAKNVLALHGVDASGKPESTTGLDLSRRKATWSLGPGLNFELNLRASASNSNLVQKTSQFAGLFRLVSA